MNWTEEKTREFIDLYPHRSNESLADHFGIAISTVKRKANRMLLRKSQATAKASRQAAAVQANVKRAEGLERGRVIRTAAANFRQLLAQANGDRLEKSAVIGKSVAKAMAAELEEWGVDRAQAELCVDLIRRGKIPGLRAEV